MCHFIMKLFGSNSNSNRNLIPLVYSNENWAQKATVKNGPEFFQQIKNVPKKVIVFLIASPLSPSPS